MPKGENLIPHVKITNTSSGKTVTLDGAEAKSVLGQIDAITAENRLKSYIRYQDPKTENQVVMELCCVEIEQLPSTIEEYEARDCDLDCCEQRFFKTVNTSVNQQTGAFNPKKSDSADKKDDKPKTDESKPSSNDASSDKQTQPSTEQPKQNDASASTDTGKTDESKPAENAEQPKTDGNTQSGDSSDPK